MNTDIFVSRGRQFWQIRQLPWKEQHDTLKYGDSEELSHIVLKQASVYIDPTAFENGKRIRVCKLPYAFIRGLMTTETPANTVKRNIRFKINEFETPFLHDDDTPFVEATFVEFQGNIVLAHYKQ